MTKLAEQRKKELKDASTLSNRAKGHVTMSVAQRLRPVTKVELYLLQLYSLLNLLDACFYSGSIVVEDRDSALFLLLWQAKSRERIPGRTKFGTHRAFLKKQDCSEWTLEAQKCGRQFEIDIPGLEIACRGASAPDVRNIVLFYGFTGPKLDVDTGKDSSRQQQNYVYMKLETSSYASARHLVSASKHYSSKALAKRLGKTQTKPSKKDTLAARREGDTPRDRRDASTMDFSSYNCDAVRNKAQRYDRLLRQGNEFFVPQPISDAILRHVGRLEQQNFGGALSPDRCP